MAYLKLFRFHQWVKNLLLFVPLITAHKLADTESVILLIEAFFSFSLCASAVYMINDLADLEADRQHPTKRHRPFASNSVPVIHGIIIAALLLLASTVIAMQLSIQFFMVLGLYFAVTLGYSLKLKSIALIDVLLLAGLYTLRIIAGAYVVNIELSFWLLNFSIFIFFSLALVKRYSELLLMQSIDKSQLAGRGYQSGDLSLLRTMGIGSGFISVLILALYIDSPNIKILYTHPEYVWLLCPLFLYWISRIWLKTHRGEMHDDPVVFALRDYASILIACIGAVIFWLAS
ncbi:MAG: UbiA family prenyltransferase [Gammaproteobacteria bacterium]|nr:UbiA family prenyltransferase [Gammaproteobacteria bacterium]MDH5594258.1 UbiA family prenyltransferase [Gammaproteobacteria bacterium]MDH5613633.1 UbiA family prenyltransferase [Gammaproteobacteria bacterium]